LHGQEAKTDPGEKVGVKVAPEEASKHKKAQIGHAVGPTSF